MQNSFLSLLSFFTFNFALAQVQLPAVGNSGAIKGIVVDSAGQINLGFVTVILQDANQKQPVINTYTNETGIFEIGQLPEKQYQLMLTHVGYKTKTISLPSFTSSTINLGKIALSPKVTPLGEVQVLAEKLRIEQDADKLTYNVEADPESLTLNTLDLLRKVPMLAVDAEDNLLLNGMDSYQILVNGQRSTLFSSNSNEVFKSLPASAIHKIEIITSPSARYAADGVGGIINIITYKKSIKGYNGSVNIAAKHPKGYLMGGYFTTKGGKFGFSGRLNTNTNNNPANNSRFYREDKVRQTRLEQSGESNSQNNSQTLSNEFTYEPTSQDLITTSFSLNRRKTNNTFLQEVAQRNGQGELTETYINRNKGQNQGKGNDFNLDYQHRFQKDDRKLFSFSFNWLNNANRSGSDFMLQPLFNYTGRMRKTQNNDDSREYTLQADYIYPIGKQTLELGIKSVFQQNTSDFFYKNQQPESGVFLLDSSQSNVFDYLQNIHAAYASFNLRKSSWSLRTGVRLEKTTMNADFTSSGTQASPQYLNLFPNISLSKLLKSNSTIKMSYSRRIDRPTLYYLNPYLDQTDPLNISYGNPNLNPANNHTLQLDYNIFVKNISVRATLVHNFTNNSIENYTTLGADSVARTTFGNLGRNQTSDFSLSGNTTIFKKLSLNVNSSTRYVKYSSQIEGRLQTNQGFTYNIQGSAAYSFNKGFRVNTNVFVSSSNVLLQGRSTGFISSSLSLQKTFLRDKNASVSFSVRSPFQKYRRTSNELLNPAFYQHRDSYTLIRQFSLSLNYRFSKFINK